MAVADFSWEASVTSRIWSGPPWNAYQAFQEKLRFAQSCRPSYSTNISAMRTPLWTR